jgi:hypothetical protein
MRYAVAFSRGFDDLVGNLNLVGTEVLGYSFSSQCCEDQVSGALHFVVSTVLELEDLGGRWHTGHLVVEENTCFQ